jgi:predicted DCC family thiol-disulfide oxidoreductase YuxK
MSAHEANGPILLFDAECGLCERLVITLLKRDGGSRLRFASLQGPFGQAALRARALPTRDFDSLLFLPAGAGGPALLRSDGALAALETLGGCLAKLARLVRKAPVPVRDFAYRCVARTRHAIFGLSRDGRLARPEWAERFIA